MTIARTSRSWVAAVAAVAFAACAVLLVPSGCSTLPTTACGEAPTASVCAQLQYQCGTAVVCYSCGAAKRIDCGSCADTQTCGGGGTPHVCWPPLPDGGAEGGAGTSAEAGMDAADGGGTAEASADASLSDAEIVEAGGPDGSDATVGATGDGSADGAVDDGGSLPEDGEAPAMVLCSDDALPPEDAGH